MTSTPAETPMQAARRASVPVRRGRDSVGATGRPVEGAGDPKAPHPRTALELATAIIAVIDDEPVVDVLPSADGRGLDSLPTATYADGSGISLEATLAPAIKAQTGREAGYLQQLFSFIQSYGHGSEAHERLLIGYLMLTHDARRGSRSRAPQRRVPRLSGWQNCYRHLPWEDWRSGRPPIIDGTIIPQLAAWARGIDPALSRAAQARAQADRTSRVRLSFGSPTSPWNEERVLSRFDLLAEAGLIFEDPLSRPTKADTAPRSRAAPAVDGDPNLGRAMAPGHRRILAAGLGRLRSDLKTRPVVFELMTEEFSLFELQQNIEAVLGPNLHKQNFRRLIETANLVEPTGRMKSHTGGRPAKLYRFRRDVLLERPTPGLKIQN